MSYYAEPKGGPGPYKSVDLDPGFYYLSVAGPGIEDGKMVLDCAITDWMNHAYAEGKKDGEKSLTSS